MIAQIVPQPLRDGDHLTRDESMRRSEAMPDLKLAETVKQGTATPEHAAFVSTLARAKG